MSTATDARFPLVCSHRPPAAPLADRVAYLTTQATQPEGASHRDQVARAAGVLNFAALIASDSGLPALASELCWRQWAAFAQAGALAPDIAVMALMPLVNIARLQARQGDGTAAFETIDLLYRAARQRRTATICGRDIDLAPLTNGPSHREACRELWAVLLTDGARALARDGRWTKAAEIMTAHRGIGSRLLDGRQVKIMSLLEQGLPRDAAAMVDSTIVSEPWEEAVAALLRLHCQRETGPLSSAELTDATAKALELTAESEPTTAAFRVRVGLTALDLDLRPAALTSRLCAALMQTAASDAYAARDILKHPGMRAVMTHHQERQLTAVVTAAGLGAGHLPPAHMDAVDAAVRQAEKRLQVLLGTDGLPAETTGRLATTAQVGDSVGGSMTAPSD